MNAKTLLLIGAVSAALYSCKPQQAALSDMAGEWSIVSLNGQAVTPETGSGQPYIGFDTKEGRIYGYSGCNRMMGALDLNAEPGKMELDKMASTRMACPDMSTEQKVLTALSEVKGYKKTGKEEFTLYNAADKAVAVLKKRCGKMKASELNGEWKIVSVSGMPIAAGEGSRTAPFLTIDTKKGRINGNAGCNTFNNSFELEKKRQGITVSPGIATLMACPEMDQERAVFDALGKACSFGKLANGNLGLFDKDSNLLLELEKKVF